MTRIITIITLSVMLSGCAKFYPAENGQADIDIPAQFSMYSEKADLSDPWWENFKSPQLNELILEATTDNFTIKEAQARLAQSRFTAEKASASKYPTLDYSAGASNLTQKNKGQPRRDTDNWSLGLNTSYEVDLWGRVLAEEKSATITAEASLEDLKTARLTVSGAIAENWIKLISLKKQQELFVEQLELQQKLLEFIKIRFPAGLSTALDIYQQQQAIERIATALIPIISRQKSIERQIAFLSGKSAVQSDLSVQKAFPTIGNLPAIGIPADLIAERPDIRAAGLKLKSSQWAITAAQADRMPALRLSASHNYSSSNFSDIFDNWLLNLAANLTGPIFDGNRRKSEVERTKAVVDERLATYQKTVFAAIKEVEDAMADESRFDRVVSSLKKQLVLSDNTMREARTRYRNGNIDFLNVLREELNNLQIRQSIITSKEDMIIARIFLHKAMGGAWLDRAQL